MRKSDQRIIIFVLVGVAITAAIGMSTIGVYSPLDFMRYFSESLNNDNKAMKTPPRTVWLSHANRSTTHLYNVRYISGEYSFTEPFIGHDPSSKRVTLSYYDPNSNSVRKIDLCKIIQISLNYVKIQRQSYAEIEIVTTNFDSIYGQIGKDKNNMGKFSHTTFWGNDGVGEVKLVVDVSSDNKAPSRVVKIYFWQ